MPPRNSTQPIALPASNEEVSTGGVPNQDDLADDTLVAQLRKATAEAQEIALQYRRENAKLKSDLAAKKAQELPSKTRRSKKKAKDPVVAAIEEDIVKLGRYFQLFYSPFLDAGAFSHPKPAFAFDHIYRFGENVDILFGTVAELYNCIPEKYHKVMREYPAFNIKFRSALDASRSQAINRLRKDTGNIFKMPPMYFEIETEKKRSSIPLIRKLLGILQNNKTGKLQYAKLPPIFYKGNDSTKSKGLFLNEVLLKIACLIIYGPSSLSSGRSVLRSNSPYHRSDRNTTTTMGLITWTMIFTRFIFSDNEECSKTGIGGNTGINYQKDLTYYKKTFIESQREQPEWIAHVFRKWNAEVFPNTVASNHPESSEKSGADAENDDEELANHLERLRLEEDPESSGSGSDPEEFPPPDDNLEYFGFGWAGPSTHKSVGQVPPPPNQPAVSTSDQSEPCAVPSLTHQTVPEGGISSQNPPVATSSSAQAAVTYEIVEGSKKTISKPINANTSNVEDLPEGANTLPSQRKPSSRTVQPNSTAITEDLAEPSMEQGRARGTRMRKSARLKGKDKAI